MEYCKIKITAIMSLQYAAICHTAYCNMNDFYKQITINKSQSQKMTYWVSLFTKTGKNFQKQAKLSCDL